jgi:hypothetical protein
MDDTKTIAPTTYVVKVGETEYTFGVPDLELIERMILVSHMNADNLVTLEACTKWLSAAAGPVVWAEIMREFMAGTIKADDLLKAMTDLVTKWATPEESPADAT